MRHPCHTPPAGRDSGWLRSVALVLLAACGTEGPAGTPDAPPSPTWSRGRSVPGFTGRPYDTFGVTGTRAGIVIALHGGGGQASSAISTTCPGGDITHPRCLHAVAAAAGLITVFPSGTSPLIGNPDVRTWNAGGGGTRPAGGVWECTSGGACDRNIDDLAYFDALLADLDTWLDVDHDRIYVTGLSNGAAMAHRLACARAGVIAAIAPVAGAVQVSVTQGCAPSRPVPVLHIHGTSDPCWTFVESDQACAASGGYKLGVDGSMAVWADRNGCMATPPQVAALPDSTADGCTSTRERYVGCAADTELIRVTGCGHAWPSGQQYSSPAVVGTATTDFDSGVIVDFFVAHTR